MSARAPQTLAVSFPSYQTRCLDGALELRLAGVISPRHTRPQQVTGVLDAVFSNIGGEAANESDIRRLPSGAREWLLQRAATLCWSETGWFQSRCDHCDQALDLPATLSDAPRTPACADFPVITVITGLGRRHFEAPNGLHEEVMARAGTSDATRVLLAHCGLGATAQEDAMAFTNNDLLAIDAAFDAACPDVADELVTRCPACTAQTRAHLDPLRFAFASTQALVGELHALASCYHWSEEAILHLPSQRRRAYAALIRSHWVSDRSWR